jgi:hypothetical protein
MRTIQQHQGMEAKMIKEIQTVLARSQGTLVEDGLGVLALFAVLVAALALPGLV